MADMEIKQLTEDSIAGQSSNPFYPKTAAEAVVTNQISSLQTFLDAFTENQNGVNGSNEYKVFSIGRSVETPITSFVDIVQQDLGVSGGIVFGYNQQDGKRYVSLVGDSAGSRVLGMTVAPDGIYQYGSDGTFKLVTTKDIVNPMHYAGVWNASTNIPTLSSTESSKAGYVYRVSTAGTQFGITFKVGDRLVYNESGVAEKWDTTDEVFSVQGMVGDIQLSGLVKINTIYSDEETGLEIFEYQPYGNNNTPASVHNKIMVPYATPTQAGLMTTQEQSIGGLKHFEDGLTVPINKLFFGGTKSLAETSLCIKSPITSGNLNDYTTIGIYPVPSMSGISNLPANSSSTKGTLIVFNAEGNGTTYIVQWFATHSSYPTLEYRIKTSNGWYSWKGFEDFICRGELGEDVTNTEGVETSWVRGDGSSITVSQGWMDLSHISEYEVKSVGNNGGIPILIDLSEQEQLSYSSSYASIDVNFSTLSISLRLKSDIGEDKVVTLQPNMKYPLAPFIMSAGNTTDFLSEFNPEDTSYIIWRLIPFEGYMLNYLEISYSDLLYDLLGTYLIILNGLYANVKWLGFSI